jgi:hypothetical protein
MSLMISSPQIFKNKLPEHFRALMAPVFSKTITGTTKKEETVKLTPNMPVKKLVNPWDLSSITRRIIPVE